MPEAPRYIVLTADGFNEPVEKLTDALDTARGGGTVYEKLCLSTAEQIHREDALAAAVRELLAVYSDVVKAVKAAEPALVEHDAHVAAIEALFPKDEEENRHA